MSKKKFIIANKGRGVINSINPLTEEDIVLIEDDPQELEETDPTVPSYVKSITQTNIQNWIEGFNNNIISGSITGDNNKTITLTRRNGTTLSIPFIDNEGGVTSDDVINTLSFNSSTGVLTAITSEGVAITTNLDGRYALLGHTHDYDKYSFWYVRVNGGLARQVGSQAVVNFVAGTNMTITRNGEDITFDAVGGTSADGNNYITSGSYNNNTKEITLTRNDGGTVTFPIAPKKTIKVIPTATYILTSLDQHRWLVFTVSCTVTIPTGMVVDDLFEGEADVNATVTFQAASGVTLRHVASVSKTLSPNGVFGIRFRASNNCVLYGTDPVNYLNQ